MVPEFNNLSNKGSDSSCRVVLSYVSLNNFSLKQFLSVSTDFQDVDIFEDNWASYFVICFPI